MMIDDECYDEIVKFAAIAEKKTVNSRRQLKFVNFANPAMPAKNLQPYRWPFSSVIGDVNNYIVRVTRRCRQPRRWLASCRACGAAAAANALDDVERDLSFSLSTNTSAISKHVCRCDERVRARCRRRQDEIMHRCLRLRRIRRCRRLFG